MNRRQILTAIFRILALAALVISVLPANMIAFAATFTVDPITWNVIGLDSNNINVGPNHFPIGARVCNTGDATTITVTFDFDDGGDKYTGDAYINLRAGTLDEVVLTFSGNGCQDVYFEVEVARDSNAYNHTRRYTISGTDASGTASTPSPRELFVEYLISQSRNSVNDMLLDGVSVPAGGTMNLMVGQTYEITLDGSTATNGYEQIESFINFPNTIFQVLSVSTDYTADTSAYVSDPDDKLYGDGCQWVNNPLSPNYRSCIETGKVGGNILVTYLVKILSIPDAPLVNPEPLSTLIYDFSGSSYHYNADYSVQTRYANIVNATVTKSFAPKIITPGDTSTLTFTITNPGPDPISSVNFADDLPSGVEIASDTAISYVNCGTPSPSGTVAAGTTSLSFTDIAVAAFGACTFSVPVTSSADGTYTNTSGNLFIGTLDTLSYATDTLVVSSKPGAPATCPTQTTMAEWTFENYTASTAYNTGPFTYSSKQADVATAQAFYGAYDVSNSAIVDPTTAPTGWSEPYASGNAGNSWGIRTGWYGSNPADATTFTTTPYFQFEVDARNYGGIGFTASYNMNGNWSNAGNYYLLYSTDGSSWTQLASAQASNAHSWQIGGVSGTTNLTGIATIYFKVFTASAQNETAVMYLDTIQVTGCPRPALDPTLSKAFSPATIAESGGTPTASTLTFSFANPNSTTLTGVGFSDTLPDGLFLSGTPTLSCSTGSISGQTVTAVAGTGDISLSGATLAANSACTLVVSVVGAAGDYINVSGNITSTETGFNTTSSGYGTSTLAVVAPPLISKSFGANSIYTGNATTLSFMVTNPNRTAALSNLAFSDNLPAGVDITPGSTSACNGTLTLTNGNPDTVALSGGSLAAGASCTISVTVTGSTTGLKDNSVTVTATGGGINLTGNTAMASLTVKDLTPDLKFSEKINTTGVANDPWSDSLIVPSGTNVYYLFTIENTGDVDLDPVSITDDTLDVSGCNTILAAEGGLPVADVSDDDHIRTCIVGPVMTVDGRVVDVAHATGIYNSADYDTVDDSASYQNGNFGHLPSAYKNMNLYDDGGAFHLNGGTYLGSSVTTTDTDGINNITYTTKSTDDGVTWTGKWIAGEGYATINATCPSNNCVVYAWFDWNRDNDFNDTDEAQSFSVVDGDNSITFGFPGDSTLPGGAYYVRFRIYEVAPSNPQTYGTALDVSGDAIVGEIEDYELFLAPTAIELVQANARPSGATPVSLLAPLALIALLGSSLALGWKLNRR